MVLEERTDSAAKASVKGGVSDSNYSATLRLGLVPSGADPRSLVRHANNTWGPSQPTNCRPLPWQPAIIRIITPSLRGREQLLLC